MHDACVVARSVVSNVMHYTVTDFVRSVYGV